MKNPATTRKELAEFADWVAQHKVALIASPYAGALNQIINKARALTNETQPCDLTPRSNECSSNPSN